VYLTRSNAGQGMVTVCLYWTAGISFAAVVWVFLRAQYDAWSAERDKFEAEQAKNSRPELNGSVNNITVSESDGGFAVRFYGRLCNIRQQATTARILVEFSTNSGRSYRMDAPAFQTRSAPSGEIGAFIQTPFDRVRLECGIPQSFDKAALICRNIPPQDLDLRSLRFMAEDSFGGVTQIGQAGLIVDFSAASSDQGQST